MKTAVVIFNLGGPDRPENIKRFLFNLFNDPLIIRLPKLLRTPLARLISNKRSKEAKLIYEQIGGKSPILEITRNQAKSLEETLEAKGIESKVFVCMRHWHPMTKEVVRRVSNYKPRNIFLLPLYPQYSTTTTKSSLDEWFNESEKQQLKANTRYVCCYPTHDKFIHAHVSLIQNKIQKLKNKKIRILFSAHSLPVSVIRGGDPYQWQVQQTVNKIMEKITGAENHVLCYQSKVTPVKWLKPSTLDEIEKAIKEEMAIIIVPIAFVSDHSETLVELDIQYKNFAKQMGAKEYHRVEALNIHPTFIEGLANLVIADGSQSSKSNLSAKICPKKFKECYHNFNE